MANDSVRFKREMGDRNTSYPMKHANAYITHTSAQFRPSAVEIPLPPTIRCAREGQSKCSREITIFSHGVQKEKHTPQFWWKLLKQIYLTEKSIIRYNNEVSKFCSLQITKHWAVLYISNASHQNLQQNMKLLNTIRRHIKLVLNLLNQYRLVPISQIQGEIATIQNCFCKLELNHIGIEILISELYCSLVKVSHD